MKKSAIMIFMCFFFSSSICWGVQPKVTVGLKTWYSAFELDEMSSDESVLGIGPALTVRFDKFFAGLSYLMNISDYSDTINASGYVDGVAVYSTMDADFKKTDIDLSFGYSFHEKVAGFVGYKRTNYDIEADFSAVGYAQGNKAARQVSNSGSGSFEGPAIGVTGNIPIQQTRFVAYGTFAYVFLSDDDTNDDFNGPAIELGAVYALENIPTSLSFGYKYQSYSGDLDSTASGFILGMNYQF